VDASAPAGYLQFVVPVDVDGEKAELLLDTGATSTSLKFSWARGRPIEARAHAAAEKASGASGPHETQVADGVSLAVAGIRRKLQAHLIPGSQDPRCREDGLLGMDMLRSCVLVFSSEDALAHCE
jgi:predicted aspartyl protease